MGKEKVIEFFNAKAENWDQRNESNDEIIKIILDSTGLRSGDTVLDRYISKNDRNSQIKV